MSLSSILALAIIVLIVLIIVLAIIYLNMTIKEKNNKKGKEKKETISEGESKDKIAKSYTKDSIFNFMEFDKIEDNMIVQKNGKRFLMVIECQGINYDLMSDIEKTSVENGFMQFLNTLRDPIQIYVQTRTINLEDSLKNYKGKLKSIENNLNLKEAKYKSMLESGKYTAKQINNQKLEVMRQKNLYEYGRDVIFNTERMSMNKNVLRKKYYLVLSYYYNDAENENPSEYEIMETAFSDLYTKCQSTIRALMLSGVNGKVLDSYDLVDLLYNAYNRDEAENYGLDRAMSAEYDSLYITAPDILDKKMNAIEKTLKEKAIDLAQESIKYAKEELKKKAEEAEEEIDELIMQLASELIDENEEFLGDEIVETAKKKVRKSKETKEENINVKKQTKAKKSIAN